MYTLDMLPLSNSSYHLFGGYIRYIVPLNHLKVEVFCNRSQLDDLVKGLPINR